MLKLFGIIKIRGVDSGKFDFWNSHKNAQNTQKIYFLLVTFVLFRGYSL